MGARHHQQGKEEKNFVIKIVISEKDQEKNG